MCSKKRRNKFISNEFSLLSTVNLLCVMLVFTLNRHGIFLLTGLCGELI